MSERPRRGDLAPPPLLQALRDDVYALATDAGRRVGDAGHDAARRYLSERMQQSGLEPYAGRSFALHYDAGDAGQMANLIGLLRGRDPDSSPILIGAHYDSCGPLPGADDNAAAIAAVLASVAPLRRLGLRRSIVIALFDGEEPPHFRTDTMGSIRFYEDQRTGPIAAAVVLDLVGHAVPVPGLEDLLFVLGAESSPDVARAVANAAVPEGIRVLPTQHRYAPDLSDHMVFRLAGRPFLFLSCGHGPDYHLASDTPDKVDYRKLAATSDYVVALVRELDDAPLTAATPCDTTSLELSRWPRCWTPAIPELRRLPAPQSRSEIDRLAGLLTQLGL
jgi:hypothetical protein